jgi:hypothetical protein
LLLGLLPQDSQRLGGSSSSGLDASNPFGLLGLKGLGLGPLLSLKGSLLLGCFS